MKLKINIFINGLRGEAVFDFLMSKKIKIKNIFVSKKFNYVPSKKIVLQKPFFLNTPNDLRKKKIEEVLLNSQADMNVVAGFPFIFPNKIILSAKYGTINLHGGKLPEYRGGSPMNWQIINNEKIMTICCIKMNEEIDGGNILCEKKIKIHENDSIRTLKIKANKYFPKMVFESLKKLKEGEGGIKQNSKKSCYWHQRNDDDGRIDWKNMNAREIFNLVRATTKPLKGAFTFINKKKVRIYEIKLIENKIRGIPGTILKIQGDGPFIVCKDLAIKVISCSINTDNLKHKDKFV